MSSLGFTSSLADLPNLVGFFSYARRDDAHEDGALTLLRQRISSELEVLLGRKLRVWQDTEAIPLGTQWEDRIRQAVAESAFFIPIVSPSALNSPHCRTEFELFLAREAELGRNDLVFPILYVPVPGITKADQPVRDVLKIIHARQYADWTEIRLKDGASAEVRREVARFSRAVAKALGKVCEPSGEARFVHDIDTWRQAKEERQRVEPKRRDRPATQKLAEMLKSVKRRGGDATDMLVFLIGGFTLIVALVFLARWATPSSSVPAPAGSYGLASIPAPAGNYGLAGVIYPANDTDSSAMIEQAQEVALVFNDMRLWLPGPRGTGKHLAAIQKRLDQGRRTRIFLLHPKSPVMPEVARASRKDLQEQIDEIERAVTRICGGRWDKAIPKNTEFEQRPLQIIGHPRYNTYSMIMTEAEARVNYYPIGTRGKEDLGHFHVYRPTVPEGGMFERLARDLDVIKAIAEDTFKEESDLVQYYSARLKKS